MTNSYSTGFSTTPPSVDRFHPLFDEKNHTLQKVKKGGNFLPVIVDESGVQGVVVEGEGEGAAGQRERVHGRGQRA